LLDELDEEPPVGLLGEKDDVPDVDPPPEPELDPPSEAGGFSPFRL
jgi:hypothetical protein